MRKDYATYTIAVIIFIVVIGFIAAIAGLVIANESNRISSGVIVDKDYDPGYSYSGAQAASGSMATYRHYSRPAKYQFCIEGEKDGKNVRYWFDVTPEEYNKYTVGDSYSK